MKYIPSVDVSSVPNTVPQVNPTVDIFIQLSPSGSIRVINATNDCT